MNVIAPIHVTAGVSLPALVERAATALSNAKTAAEILDARDVAAIAIDAAKRAARFAKARQAADELIAAAYRAEADAHEIQAEAKRRLADEYDAAQERGEINSHGGNRGNQHTGGKFEENKLASLKPIEMHEARLIRDAEDIEPGVVRRALDEALDAGEEPTKATIRRAVERVAKKPRRVRGHRLVIEETQHDRDLRMLFGVWEAACESARSEFLKSITDGA